MTRQEKVKAIKKIPRCKEYKTFYYHDDEYICIGIERPPLKLKNSCYQPPEENCENCEHKNTKTLKYTVYTEELKNNITKYTIHMPIVGKVVAMEYKGEIFSREFIKE